MVFVHLDSGLWVKAEQNRQTFQEATGVNQVTASASLEVFMKVILKHHQRV